MTTPGLGALDEEPKKSTRYEAEEISVDVQALFKGLRKRLRLTQAQLAAVLLTTSDQVHRVERPAKVRKSRRHSVVHFRVQLAQRLTRALERHGAERAWPRGALTLLDRIAVILLLSADDPQAVQKAAGLQP